MNPPRPLTIALLIATPGTTWGGMEQHTSDLAKALTERGHNVHILGHRAYREKFLASLGFHSLPVQLGRHNPWLRLAVRRQLRQIAPDIVHAHGNKAAQLIGNARRVCGVTVGTVHGTKSSHRAFQRLDHVIAVSQQIFNRLPHESKRLIYNGVDINASSHAGANAPELPATGRNVIAVGRLEPVKGFEKLIRVWARLGSIGDNCHLTIFGDGSQRERLETLIDQLNLSTRVTLAGFCPDLAEVYRQADITVISSEREGFPYVLAESLVNGCPVVSTPISGAIDILPSAALSTGHDEQSLCDLLMMSLSDLSTLKRTQAPAMTFARKTLTLQEMASQTEQLYLEALSKHS